MPNNTSQSLLLRLLSYLRPHTSAIVITWVLSILILVAQAAAIWVGSEFVEKLLLGEQRYSGGIGTFYFDQLANYLLVRDDQFQSLLFAMLFVASCGIGISVLRVVKLYLLAKINQNELLNIRSQLFQKLIKLNILFSRKYMHGETSSIFINDVNQLNYAFVDLIDRIFMQPLRLLFALVLMCTISWQITLITLACLIPSALLIHWSGVKIQQLVTTVLEKVAALQGHLTEYLAIVSLARSLGNEQRDSRDFNDKSFQLRDAQQRLMLMDAVAPQIVRIIAILATAVLTLIGGKEVLIDKSMEGGDLIKLALLLPMLTYPVEALASLYVSLRTSFASAKRIFALMDQKAYDEPQSGQTLKQRFETSIEMQSVDHNIGDTRILTGVSIKFQKGLCHLVIGPSGAGKSSLLALLAKFAAPQNGSIEIDGVDLATIDSNSWRKCLGIVAQDSILINASIRQNLLYAKPGATDEEMLEVLRTVKLEHLDESHAEVLNRQVGNRGEFLSGGERQRFSIARALLTDPDLLLIDEPTASLDKENSRAIIELLKQLRKTRTMIIVSHDPLLKSIADVEIELDKGQIARVHQQTDDQPDR